MSDIPSSLKVRVAEEIEMLFQGHSIGKNLIYLVVDDGPKTSDIFKCSVFFLLMSHNDVAISKWL